MAWKASDTPRAYPHCLVEELGIAPRGLSLQGTGAAFCHPQCLVVQLGVAPTSSGYQPLALLLELQNEWWDCRGLEPRSQRLRAAPLPVKLAIQCFGTPTRIRTQNGRGRNPTCVPVARGMAPRVGFEPTRAKFVASRLSISRGIVGDLYGNQTRLYPHRQCGVLSEY